MTTFLRTFSGLISENRFRKGEICVYTEGKTDYPFYKKIFNKDTTLSKFSYIIRPLGGKQEAKKEELCKKLACELVGNAHRYIVILDGHYDILEPTPSETNRIILLSRHSFENYLFEEAPIREFCDELIDRDKVIIEDYLKELRTDFQEFLKTIKTKFMELLVLDIAHQRAKTGKRGFLRTPNKFFNGKGVDFLDEEIDTCLEGAKAGIGCKDVKSTRNLVDKFLRKHRFIDLLPGHFAFGLIRRFVIHKLRQGGVTVNTADLHIRTPLSRLVWDFANTRDHESLSQQLCKAVREADQMRK